MFTPSNRIQRIRPSATLVLNAKASAMKAAGKPVINLTVGELDFNTPPWICEAATQAMAEGLTRYTPTDGMPALKVAIQTKVEKTYGLEYDLNEIMVSTGGKQVIFNAMLATLNPQDEVIIPAPYWVSYPEIVALFGGVCRNIPCDEGNNFKLSPEDLEKAITPRTRWLILNSPSNPTGATYTKDELRALAKVLYANPHVWVLCDDIYENLLYDQNTFHSLVRVEPRLKFRTLIVNGVSKSYAMTGWRIGYGLGPSDLIQAMSMAQSQSTSNPCSIAQAATIAALNGPHDFLGGWRQTLQNRRDVVFERINSIRGLRCAKPEGAFYLYVHCGAFIGTHTPNGQIIETDTILCEYILETAHVALVSGTAFGLSPYVRLSYTVEEHVLSQACERLKTTLEKLTIC
jgi:aspartate aminotransferase